MSKSKSSEVDLTIVACPEKHLAFTNYVYCSLTESALLKSAKQDENFVQINGMIYNVAGHKLINAGEIGLSSVQRTSCKVQQGAATKVSRWAPPTDGSANLISVHIYMELMTGGRKILKEDEVSECFANQYAGQPFSKGQELIMDYVGTPLKFTVRELQAPKSRDSKENDGAITEITSRGIFLSTTSITIEPEDSKFLKFEKSNKKKNVIFDANFSFDKMNIGGLDAQFNTLFRRAFASRLLPPKVRKELGIKHVRGILLYGPPGTGKTLIARQIGKMLTTVEPKKVNGPDILDKFVGESERKIRDLFADAEKDFKENGENANLHIIIFDEIDAICKSRGTRTGDSGVGDTVVNQLLTKIDGVDSPDNFLVIGMTNRKDLLDPALLRPGRLEVHIEISLPDEKGRKQIFNIHTKTMRECNRLAKDVSIDYLASVTKNYSGAEIESVVKSASSFAVYRSIDVTKGDQVSIKSEDKSIVVGMEAFQYALEEVKPDFGVDEDEIKTFLNGDLLDYGPVFSDIMGTVRAQMELVKKSPNIRLQSLLLYGPSGSGKTSIAAKLALDSDFPYAKIISPSHYVGVSEAQKVREIAKVFEDAYKTPTSLIIVDNIERLIEYVPVGPRFSANLLQTLLVLINNVPPHENRRIMVLATTANMRMIDELGFHDVFMNEVEVPALNDVDQVMRVLELCQIECPGGEAELREIAKATVAESDDGIVPDTISIKRLLAVIDSCKLGGDFSLASYKEALRRANKVYSK